jgi:hypothetical protein
MITNDTFYLLSVFHNRITAASRGVRGLFALQETLQTMVSVWESTVLPRGIGQFETTCHTD